MNYLAHLFLAGPDPALRTGGFLGDFVRGPLDGRHAPSIELGIALHRHIDATTDRHAAVREAVAAFRAPWRRWAPVALDLWFDHLLAQRFEALGGEPLEDFSQRAYGQLEAHRQHLPPTAQRFLERMREVDLLVRYRQAETLDGVLERLARRSPRAAPLADLSPELHRLAPLLAQSFERLLPDLVDASTAWRKDRGQQVD
jgi:acyl carrier protein phosphodiesterase